MAGMSQELNQNRATKLLIYKDAVAFRVPDHWLVSKEDDDGQIAIYDDREGSGTLRPWTEEYQFDDEAARDAMAHDLHNGQSFEPLNEWTTLSQDIHSVDGVYGILWLHQWIVTIRASAKRLRVVTFTHTLDAKIEDRDDTNYELRVVDLVVRSALYLDAEPEIAT